VKMMGIIEARVRCGGELHRVVWKNGAVAFPNHGGVRGLSALRVLAQAAEGRVRCADILAAIQSGRYSEFRALLPAAFRRQCREAFLRRQERRIARMTGADPLTRPLRQRLEERLVREARRVLKRCAYRRSRARWVGGDHEVTVECGAQSGADGGSIIVWSRRRRWSGTNSWWRVTITPRWLRALRLCGGAVQGIFILEILGEHPRGGWRASAVRQGPGFQIYPCPARIWKNGGVWQIRWER